MPTNSISNSGNQALDIEIANLVGIDTGSHTNSKQYNKLTDALTALSACIAKYYPNDISAAPVLSTAQLYEINDAYVNAIRECNNYTSGKGTSRRSGYGQARLKTVTAIRQILDKDLLSIQDLSPSERTTLPAIIRTARTDDVRLMVDEADLKVVGGNSSTRVPMSINTVAGRSEGFFTEDYQVLSIADMHKALCERHDMKPEALGMFFRSTDAKGDFAKKNFVYALDRLQMAREELETDSSRVSREDLINDPDTFRTYFDIPFLEIAERDIYQSEKIFDAVANTPEKRRAFLDAMDDVLGMADEYSGSHLYSNITLGQNIPNRNVGMSRVADMLGMGSLVAKATRMDIKDNDGYVREGVFQEAVKGSDINHLQQNDPLFTIGDHPELMDDPNVLKQIADLQVLDYICGNTDRHQGNMLYQFKEVDGEMKFLGIKGIDNDRSFGCFNADDARERGFITPPEMMKVMSRSALNAIRSLDKEKLTIALKDLHFEDSEIELCIKRRNDILIAVNKKLIDVVEDNEFGKHKMDELAMTARYRDKRNGEEHEKYNLFEMVGDIRTSIKHRVPNESGPLKFNEAASIDKEHERVNFSISMDSLSADKDSLKFIEDDFVKTDRKLHINSGGYKWMLSSLRAVRDEIEKLEQKYGPNDKLSAADAKHIDDLYRAMRKASNDYLADHKDPHTTMGKIRKYGAEFMSSLRPLNADMPYVQRIITASSIGKLEAKLDAEKEANQSTPPKKKERITKASVAKKAAGKKPAQMVVKRGGGASSSSSANREWSF
ncbi:MAG: hypothetical protein IKQ83_01025 [Lachnospiraceae bacterium]|nr:hypothetical protein [Lachnospiraceae bacterium]